MSNARAFKNRHEAGAALAALLQGYARRNDVVVLALPRGGVPVAYEVAAALQVPLDVFSVRKLGVPGHPELAMGAIASGGVQVLNEEVLAWCRPSADTVEAVARMEMRELERRERLYREGRPLVLVEGRTVDSRGRRAGHRVHDARGGAGGSSAPRRSRDRGRARRRAPIPARRCDASPTTSCACSAPDHFVAVGAWYEDFSETSDDEVRRLIAWRSGRLQTYLTRPT